MGPLCPIAYRGGGPDHENIDGRCTAFPQVEQGHGSLGWQDAETMIWSKVRIKLEPRYS